jgi:hypothetical protein
MAGYCTYCIFTKQSLDKYYFEIVKTQPFLTVGLLRQDSAKHPYIVCVRHVTGNDQDYLGESPEWLFRYLRFSKRATVGVRATYATR